MNTSLCINTKQFHSPPKNGILLQNASTLQGFMGHSVLAIQHDYLLWNCMNRANIIFESWCNRWNISHSSVVHILTEIVEGNKKLQNLRERENHFLLLTDYQKRGLGATWLKFIGHARNTYIQILFIMKGE